MISNKFAPQRCEDPPEPKDESLLEPGRDSPVGWWRGICPVVSGCSWAPREGHRNDPADKRMSWSWRKLACSRTKNSPASAPSCYYMIDDGLFSAGAAFFLSIVIVFIQIKKRKLLHGYDGVPVMKTAFPWGKKCKFLQSFPEPSTDIPFLQYSVHHRGCECRHGDLEP